MYIYYIVKEENTGESERRCAVFAGSTGVELAPGGV
jgi:hypothetical protein